MFIEINKVQKSSGSKYRLFAIVIVCIFSISSFAQDRQSQDVLKRSEEEINKHLPITVQYGITFTTVAIAENSGLETIEIEGSDVSFSTLSKNRSLMKKTYLGNIKRNLP